VQAPYNPTGAAGICSCHQDVNLNTFSVSGGGETLTEIGFVPDSFSYLVYMSQQTSTVGTSW
jgi:hypothetical protein